MSNSPQLIVAGMSVWIVRQLLVLRATLVAPVKLSAKRRSTMRLEGKTMFKKNLRQLDRTVRLIVGTALILIRGFPPIHC